MRSECVKLRPLSEESKKSLEDFKFNDALISIWDLVHFCDKYINQEKPWEGKDNALLVISDIMFALDNISELLLPFLPETAEKIKKSLKGKTSEILFPRLGKP